MVTSPGGMWGASLLWRVSSPGNIPSRRTCPTGELSVDDHPSHRNIVRNPEYLPQPSSTLFCVFSPQGRVRGDFIERYFSVCMGLLSRPLIVVTNRGLLAQNRSVMRDPLSSQTFPSPFPPGTCRRCRACIEHLVARRPSTRTSVHGESVGGRHVTAW